MWNWLRELMELRQEFRERRLDYNKKLSECNSCDNLKQINDHLRMDNQKLLEKILDKPVVESEPNSAPPMLHIPNKAVPWNIRRQMLEAEDRQKAQALRNAGKPLSGGPTEINKSIEDLEKEMQIVASQRESENAAGNSK